MPEELILEVMQIHELSEKNPQELLMQIDRIRSLKSEGAQMPEKYQALARYVFNLAPLKKRGFAEFLLLDEYSWSYATPSDFGAYRSKKISSLFPNMKVADISCGSGSQLIELCKVTSAVGFERDELRYWLAKINVNLAFHLKLISSKPLIFNLDGLSPQAVDNAKEHTVILCDSWRVGNIYSPDLHKVKEVYKDRYLVYELKPLEKINQILNNYNFLFGKSEIEFYGEGDRCSRLTVYFGKGNSVKFVQHDEVLDLELSYAHEKVESASFSMPQKIISGFPTHDFCTLNRAIVENFFEIGVPVFSVDKKRYLCEIPIEKKAWFKKKFSLAVSSNDITEITAFLKDNYDDYNVTLRFEVPSEQYWNFVKVNELITDRESGNKFSLFKCKETYHLAEEVEVKK